MSYTLSEEQKKRFAGLYLLEYMINTPHAIPIFLDDNDKDLEPVLEWLMMKGYIQILHDEKYIPHPNGRKELEKFLARYSEYLTMFDIFCAVDLQAGEFAFSRYFDFATDAEFQDYLDDERWDDLRVAVADFKEMNPVEIVFMSFISEKRFGRNQSGWQFDLLLGSVWDEILHICNTALQWQQLGYEDEEGYISAEEVIADIIRQGMDIMLTLLAEEEYAGYQAFNDIESDEIDDDFFVDRVTMPDDDLDYYDRYRDPYYKSSRWN
ncbi:hypothetical protein EH223_10925 [candidate division KSB1 bacterium]|nr:hypothetical protein [candidate division KSB1 bacterium]RQW03134.1 MAG: hypothetical protein EH223_10925 [candidate division KSB1 bacterium]